MKSARLTWPQSWSQVLGLAAVWDKKPRGDFSFSHRTSELERVGGITHPKPSFYSSGNWGPGKVRPHAWLNSGLFKRRGHSLVFLLLVIALLPFTETVPGPGSFQPCQFFCYPHNAGPQRCSKSSHQAESFSWFLWELLPTVRSAGNALPPSLCSTSQPVCIMPTSKAGLSCHCFPEISSYPTEPVRLLLSSFHEALHGGYWTMEKTRWLRGPWGPLWG